MINFSLNWNCWVQSILTTIQAFFSGFDIQLLWSTEHPVWDFLRHLQPSLGSDFWNHFPFSSLTCVCSFSHSFFFTENIHLFSFIVCQNNASSSYNACWLPLPLKMTGSPQFCISELILSGEIDTLASCVSSLSCWTHTEWLPVTVLPLSQISSLVWVEKLFMVAQRGQGEGIISPRNLILTFLVSAPTSACLSCYSVIICLPVILLRPLGSPSSISAPS